MLFAAILLAAQSFGSAYPEFFRAGQEDAFVQDQLPVVCGPKMQNLVSIGLYTLTFVQGTDRIGLPEDREVSKYVGDTQSKVTKDKLAGEDCFVIKSTGLRPKITTAKAGIVSYTQTLVYSKQRICWVNEKGKLVHEIDVFTTDKGTFTANASFNKDDIEIIWNDPSGKYEKTVLNPADGVEPFDREFAPMISGKDVVMQTKDFCRLDPIAKAFRKYKARVLNTFTAKVMGKDFHGHIVELTCENLVQKVYVSDAGDLLQVDLPHGHFLYRNQVPDGKTEKLSLIQQRLDPLASSF